MERNRNQNYANFRNSRVAALRVRFVYTLLRSLTPIQWHNARARALPPPPDTHTPTHVRDGIVTCRSRCIPFVFATTLARFHWPRWSNSCAPIWRFVLVFSGKVRFFFESTVVSVPTFVLFAFWRIFLWNTWCYFVTLCSTLSW